MQIILLDTRSFKSLPVLVERPAGAGGGLSKYVPTTDSAATLLGDAQWSWLEQQLREPAELGLIASSGQVIADQNGMDEWGRNSLVDFTSSGLTHVKEDYSRIANPYRVAGPFFDKSFGLVEIDWHGNDPPTLTLSAVGVDGRRAFEYHFPEESAK